MIANTDPNLVHILAAMGGSDNCLIVENRATAEVEVVRLLQRDNPRPGVRSGVNATDDLLRIIDPVALFWSWL